MIGRGHIRAAAMIALAGTAALGQSRADVTHALARALADPLEEAAVQGFLSVLPRDGALYVVEGDLLMSERDVRTYLVAKAQGGVPVDPSKGLHLRPSRSLEAAVTYRADRDSFPSAESYQRAAEALEAAAGAWRKSCRECKTALAPAVAGKRAAVTARFHDANGAYLVAGRAADGGYELRIDRSFLGSDVDRTGLLRHALGHALGYRHPLDPSAGCFLESGRWKPLREVKPLSVMSPYCSRDAQPELTRLDERLHAEALREPRPFCEPADAGTPFAPDAGTLVLRFEGGDVATNVAVVLETMEANGTLPTAKVLGAQGACAALKERVPGPCTSRLLSLLARLNGTTVAALQAGAPAELKVPDVSNRPYTFLLKLDPTFRKDRIRADSIVQNWGGLILDGGVDVSSGLRQFTLRGYELQLRPSTAEAANQTIERLGDISLKNVVVEYERGQAAGGDTYYSFAEPLSFFARYQSPVGAQAGEEGALSFLASDAVPQHCPCSPEERPEVVLIDQRVSNHPDLTPPPALAAAPVVGFQRGTRVSFDERSQHGTHLAGIIAARQNGFGLLGLDPFARVTNWVWRELGVRRARDRLVGRVGDASSALPLFVFAARWLYDQPADLQDGRLKRAEFRTGRNQLAKEIEHTYSHWIVAAGQAEEPDGLGQPIDELYPSGPMNLGDLPNVVVVSACQNAVDGGSTCKDDARLWPNANFGARMVHVAAPGLFIPSTATDEDYAVATGTSQSAAYVAGVASAMMCCHRAVYARPGALKARLQYTSRPAFLEGPRKIAAGIVDPSLALRAPDQDWFWPAHAGTGAADEFAKLERFHWCSLGGEEDRQITLRNAFDDRPVEGGAVASSDVYRIIRVRSPVTHEQEWVIFAKGERTGEVRMIGPGVLMPQERQRALFQANGNPFAIGDVRDLLVRESRATEGCAR